MSRLRLAPPPVPLTPPSYDEWEAAPLADAETRGCPNCGGRHYTIVHPLTRYSPGLYACRGTEWPNADGYESQEPCGTRFRGRPGIHYAEDWFAYGTVVEFIARFASRPAADTATKDET